MPENWRGVVGWPAYEVSDHGRVRRAKEGSRGHKVGTIRKPDPGKWGHLRLTLRDPDGRCASRSVHSLVLEAFVGPKPTDKHEAAHGDGKPSNNRLGNLRWATKSENELDKAVHGTSNRGDRQHMARLTADQAVAIIASPASQTELARQYGVSRSCITHIKQGNSWRWLSALPITGPLFVPRGKVA